MKKFTDKYFRFPAKVYIKKEVREAIKTSKDGEIVDEPRWVQGWKAIPFQEIKSWGEDTMEEKDIDEILEKGYDATYLSTYTEGMFDCLWPIKRFEMELNKAYDNYLENYKDVQVLIKSPGQE